MSNVETVQEIYEAFGKGDIPFILNQLAEDIEWDPGSSADVPWLLPRKGREAVGGFFESLAGFNITKFVPTSILDGGDVVVALIDIEATATKTGVAIREDDQVHVWRFNSQDKVIRFAHKLDSHAHWTAYHGGVSS